MPIVAGCLLLVCSACNFLDSVFGRRAVGQDSRIIWRIAGRTNDGVPWYDDSTAYFLGEAHTVTAVYKNTGAIRWAITLPGVARPSTLGDGGFVSGDRVIVGDDQEIFAISKADGRILWRFASTHGRDLGRDAPVGSDGLVFAGSANGYLFALDLDTGLERWSIRLPTSTSAVVWLGAIVNGTVFVSLTDFDIAPERGPQGAVAAVEAATGGLRWFRWLPHNVDSLAPTATIDPVVAGSVVVASSRDGPVYGFDVATGELRWKAPALPTPGSTTPATIRDIRWLCANSLRVYLGSEGAHLVIAVNPDTGRELWRIETPLGSPSWIRCDDTYVLVFYPGGELGVYAAPSGAHLWSLTSLHDRQNHFFVGGAIDGDQVYTGGIYNISALRLD